MPTGTKLTEAQKGAFIAALGGGCTIAEACSRAEISQPAVYALRTRNEGFAEAWAEARRIAADIHRERQLDRRAEAWRANDKLVADPAHAAHAAAVKLAVEKAVPESSTEETGADGVAEAIDRFTATVLQLAQREPIGALPPVAGGRPDVAALIPRPEGEG